MPTSPYLIAIIEDEAGGILLHDRLKNAYTVVSYPDVASALTGMLAKVADIVLLDVDTKDLETAITAMAAVRARPSLSQVRVIAFAETARLRDRDQYLAMGFVDYVSKAIFNIEAGGRLLEAHIKGLYRAREAH